MPERFSASDPVRSDAFWDGNTVGVHLAALRGLSATVVTLPVGLVGAVPVALGVLMAGAWQDPGGLVLVAGFLGTNRRAICSHLRIRRF